MSSIKKFLTFGSLLILSGFVLFFQTGNLKQKSSTPRVESVSATISPQTTSIDQSGETIKVTRVIDGDTIVLANGERVRYIGMDTPEIRDPKKPVQCFGTEAAAKNKELVEGKIIRLVKDVSERDKYQRLLRYVYVGDIFVNDYLVRQGYAHASTYPPDIKYSRQFLEAEKEARENNRGLWSQCDATSSLATPSFGPSAMNNELIANIDCSHNVYNCTNFKTQSEAQTVFDYCMKSVGYDIHKLDRDGDGKVCETLP